jgi:hypothetical protein
LPSSHPPAPRRQGPNAIRRQSRAGAGAKLRQLLHVSDATTVPITEPRAVGPAPSHLAAAHVAAAISSSDTVGALRKLVDAPPVAAVLMCGASHATSGKASAHHHADHQASNNARIQDTRGGEAGGCKAVAVATAAVNIGGKTPDVDVEDYNLELYAGEGNEKGCGEEDGGATVARASGGTRPVITLAAWGARRGERDASYFSRAPSAGSMSAPSRHGSPVALPATIAHAPGGPPYIPPAPPVAYLVIRTGLVHQKPTADEEGNPRSVGYDVAGKY